MPATYAKISLLTGDQGGGKSTIGTSFAITDYYRKMTGLWTPMGRLIKAKSVDRIVNPDDYLALRRAGIAPHVLKYARIFSNDGKDSKLIRIPQDWKVESPVHIFANYHLYGVRYKLADLAFVIENMNTNLFYEAWILMDEGPMSSRRSMEKTGKLGGEFSASIRKRQCNFVAMTQYNRMIEVLIRLFATTRISCSFEPETKLITCEGTRRGDPLDFDVYAPDYWPFFDTEEIIETPQYRIDRALQQVYKTGALVG
jgi:hypothetical protein